MQIAIRTRVKQFFHVDQPVLGMDLSDGIARAVSLERSSTGVRVSSIGMTEIPSATDVGQQSQSEDIPISSELLVAAKRLWSDVGIRSRMVAVAVPSRAAFLRRLVVPRIESSRLRELVTYEIARAVAVDDVAIDFQVFRDASPDRLEVDVVVVRSAHVQGLLEKVSSMGLLPVAVDVATYAIQTAYEFGYAEDLRRHVLVIYFGRCHVTCFVSHRGELCWTAEFPLSVEPNGELDRISESISKVVEHVRSAHTFEGRPLSIDKVLIGGFVHDATRAVGLARTEFHVECHEFDPLRKVLNSEECRRSLPVPLSFFCISFGLALRHQLVNYRDSYERRSGRYVV